MDKRKIEVALELTRLCGKLGHSPMCIISGKDKKLLEEAEKLFAGDQESLHHLGTIKERLPQTVILAAYRYFNKICGGTDETIA